MLGKLGFFIEYLLVLLLRGVCLAIGYKISIKFGKILGRILYFLPLDFKRYAFQNALVVYEKVDARVKSIIMKAFENMGLVITTSFFLEKINKDNFERFVVFEDFSYIEQALSYGKGVLVVTGHFGNWEFLAGVPSKLGMVNLGVVMNRQVNPFTEKLILRTRKRANMKTFYNTPDNVKSIISHLKVNGVVGMVVDQAYYFDPIFVEFFGKNAPCARGPAVFHLKFGAPIVMARSILMEDGRFKLKFYPPKVYSLSYSEENVKRIIYDINKTFEEWIMERPEEWFSWNHPRWDVEGIVWHKKV